MRRVFVLSCAVACAIAIPAAALAKPGFKTSSPAMIDPVKAGVTVEPLLTVGDTLRDGYRFESIPDGIALRPRGRGTVDVYVNHETSLVPFPGTLSDFGNAMVSRLRVHQRTAGILDGEFVIPSEANYQRFCSSFLADREHGFEFPILLTNEEATDFVNRVGQAWPADPARPGYEQAGVVVAYDVKRDRYRTIYGMGRHNHENSVAIPGYGHPVVLSGDDTFNAPSSQLYLYTAEGAKEVWDDEGTLWAFVSDNPAVNDYGDLTLGGGVSGKFVEVPRSIAVGDQTGLENWSNANNVFQFIRLEDIAYDRRNPRIVYLADTGEPRAIPDAATTRLRRGPSGTTGPYPNGRLFKLVLDRRDPLRVESLSIAHDADAGGYRNPMAIHNLDNLETVKGSVFIQEDPGGHNQGTGAWPTARIWRFDIATGATEVIAAVDQSLDPAASNGAWESSGIVDASDAFGRGAFLVDVQAGTLIVEEKPGDGVTHQREGGQLLLLRVPAAGHDDDDDRRGRRGHDDDDHDDHGRRGGGRDDD